MTPLLSPGSYEQKPVPFFVLITTFSEEMIRQSLSVFDHTFSVIPDAAESSLFCRDTSITLADVDLQRLQAARLSESSFNELAVPMEWQGVRTLNIGSVGGCCDLAYAHLSSHPFVPSSTVAHARCAEILNIQAAALAKMRKQ